MTPTNDTPPQVYVAVIGDMVESRDLSDRASVQDRFLEAVAAFNQREGGLLSAPLRITGGDEMKTILEDPVVVVDLLTRVSEDLYPIPLAWGVGRGPLGTRWSDDVGAMDGPCFHRARRAVEEASANGVWARAHGFSPLDDDLMSGLLRLMGALRSSWTETQVGYIRSVREKSQRETARELGVTEGAVSQSLRSARFHDVAEGEAVLRELLGAYRGHETRPARPSAAGSRETS